MHSLGSCVLYLHIDNKVFPTVFEVTNTPGPMILGRIQVKAMGYVQFPQIQWPHAFNIFRYTSRNLCAHKTPTTKTTETASSTPSLTTQNHIKRGNQKQNKHSRLQNQYYLTLNGTQTPYNSMVRHTSYQSPKTIY